MSNLAIRKKKPELAITFAASRIYLLLFQADEILAADILEFPTEVLGNGIIKEPERLGLELHLWLKRRNYRVRELSVAINGAYAAIETVKIKGLSPDDLRSAAVYESLLRGSPGGQKQVAAVVLPSLATHPDLALVGRLPAALPVTIKKLAETAELNLRQLTLSVLSWNNLLAGEGDFTVILAQGSSVNNLLIFKGPELLYSQVRTGEPLGVYNAIDGDYLPEIENYLPEAPVVGRQLFFWGQAGDMEDKLLRSWASAHNFILYYSISVESYGFTCSPETEIVDFKQPEWLSLLGIMVERRKK